MHTLEVHIVISMELNRVDFERKCGINVITQRVGDVCYTQTFCYLV